MPRKPRETPPEGGEPNPPRERPAKGIAITLQPAQEQQLRRLAAKTKMGLGELRIAVETSPRVADAITAELKSQLNKWLERQAADDPFAAREESRG